MKRIFAACLVFGALILAGGCGGGGSTGTAGIDVEGATTPTATTFETTASTIVEPNHKCIEAFAEYAKALADDSNVNEGRFQEATIRLCGHDEWLTAVEGYTEGANCIACVNPERVLWHSVVARRTPRRHVRVSRTLSRRSADEEVRVEVRFFGVVDDSLGEAVELLLDRQEAEHVVED